MSSRPLIAPWRLRLRFGFRNGRLTAAWGLLILLAWLCLAVFAPWIAPYAPEEQLFDGLTLEGAPLPPDARFIMGTDLLGRDLFSRILYGAQTSLIIGVVANGLALLIGTLMSALFSGYMAYYLAWPLAYLRRAMSDVAQGRFETRVKPAMGKRRDEIVDLAEDCDRMANQLKVLVQAQQHLLHDISHELRSPLARLK